MKMPKPTRGTASGKTSGKGLTGTPSTGIGANNQGSAAAKSGSGLSGLPNGIVGADNRGPQPAGK